jgi:hypothetical protein
MVEAYNRPVPPDRVAPSEVPSSLRSLRINLRTFPNIVFIELLMRLRVLPDPSRLLRFHGMGMLRPPPNGGVSGSEPESSPETRTEGRFGGEFDGKGGRFKKRFGEATLF